MATTLVSRVVWGSLALSSPFRRQAESGARPSPIRAARPGRPAFRGPAGMFRSPAESRYADSRHVKPVRPTREAGAANKKPLKHGFRDVPFGHLRSIVVATSTSRMPYIPGGLNARTSQGVHTSLTMAVSYSLGRVNKGSGVG